MFLTYAAAWAWPRRIGNLVAGVAQTDYSGYPDRRAATLESLEQTLRLGMESDICIHAPPDASFEKGNGGTRRDARSAGCAGRDPNLLPGFAAALRQLSCLPPARARIRGCRRRGSVAGPLRDSAVTYSVKEIYFTLQGEGAQTGRAAVFCACGLQLVVRARAGPRRTAGVPLLRHGFRRHRGPGGGQIRKRRRAGRSGQISLAGQAARARRVRRLHRRRAAAPARRAAVDEMHARGLEVGVETNGTVAAPPGIDWIA